ncbi:hypothetical protein G5I_05790 [Acromyrmex echinatior]|uniref:Uncharacterized protein n=1 Tax=Acromyrmex echinatior TaxID=103372 RepID=F4WJB2_ACREC|nr:hypothetical protein G5I_05790 [Acromyrmex echinatior]
MLVAASKRGGEGYHRERRKRRKKDNTCARACESEKEKRKAKWGWNYRGREMRRKSGQNKEEGDKNQSGSQRGRVDTASRQQVCDELTEGRVLSRERKERQSRDGRSFPWGKEGVKF